MACIRRKCYCKIVFQVVFCFFRGHSFPCQSQLLGSNIPNDISGWLAGYLFLGLSQICSKICSKYFWELRKFFTYYALNASIICILCSNVNNTDVKLYCLNILFEYLQYKNRSVWFYLRILLHSECSIRAYWTV